MLVLKNEYFQVQYLKLV